MTRQVRLKPGAAPPFVLRQTTRLDISPVVDAQAVFGDSAAIYIAMDRSQSMSFSGPDGDVWDTAPETTRWWALLTGLQSLLGEIKRIVETGAEPERLTTIDGTQFLASLAGEPLQTIQSVPQTRHDLYLRPFDVVDGIDDLELRQMLPADYDTAIAWLNQWYDVEPRGQTPYDVAVDPAPAFFAAAQPDRRLLLFFTDGEPNPAASLDAAEATLDGIEDLDVYAYSILREDTSDVGRLDTTPSDGVPVLSSLTATSWGVWDATISPPTWVLPATPVEPQRTAPTAAVVMSAIAYNAGSEPATLKARVVAGPDVYTLIAGLTIPAGELVALPLDQMVVAADEVLQIGGEIGDNLRVTLPYILRTEEVAP
ncbi:MAG: hypothetical protein ACOCYW_06545 [Roseicyclus sp.]